jgi:hypothetical protein
MLRQLALRAAPPLTSPTPEDPEPDDPEQPPRRPRRSIGGPPSRPFYLVPVTDPTGRLLGVVWQARRRHRVVAEGVALVGDLSTPERRTAHRWGARHPSRASRPADPADAATHVERLEKWLGGHLWRLGVKRQFGRDGSPRPAPTLICWEPGFDLSRPARYWGRVRDRPRAFSLALFGRPGTDRTWERASWQPLAIVEQVAPHITFARWSVERREGDPSPVGTIIGLRHPAQTFTGAVEPGFEAAYTQLLGGDAPAAPVGWKLTGRLLTAARARLDAQVRLTARLCDLVDAWRAGGVDVSLGGLFSTASLAKRVLASTGRTPPATKCASFAPDAYAAFVGAFHGPKAYATVLRWPAPAVVGDGSGHYCRMAARLGIDETFCAEAIRSEAITADDVERLLGSVDLPALFDSIHGPGLWRELGRVVVMFQPAGAWLQHRWFTGDDVESATAPLDAPVPLPYSALDLAGAIVHDGELRGTVLRGWRVVCEGRLPTKDVHTPGAGTPVGGGDLFEGLLAVREALHAAGDAVAESCIKRLSNSAAFGVSAQVDRSPLRHPQRRDFVDPWGVPFEAKVPYDETPGAWAFFPSATAITAAARLELTIAEQVWADKGGTVLAAHTDSLVYAAAPEPCLWPCPGGEDMTDDREEAIRVLGWDDVRDVHTRLAAIGSVWKVEHDTMDRPVVATVYGIGRTVLHDPATGELVDNPETMLGGVLLDPSGRGDARLADGRRAWVADPLAAVAATPFPGVIPLGSYAECMAVSAWRVSTPAMLAWRPPGARPFDPFLLAHEAPGPTGPAGASGSPTAPFDPDPERWPYLQWQWRNGSPVDRMVPPDVARDATRRLGPGDFAYATVGDLVYRWRLGGSAGGRPAHPDARPSQFAGLYRKVATVASDDVVLIGRDGDRLLEQALGVIVDPADRLTVLTGPGDYIGSCRTELLRAVVGGPLRRVITRRSGVSQRTVRAFLAGAEALRAARRLADASAAEAGDRLVAAGWPWEDVRHMPLGVRLAELERLGPRPDPRTSISGPDTGPRCAYPGCEQPPVPPSDACAAHRAAMQRQRNRARRRKAGDSGGQREAEAP